MNGAELPCGTAIKVEPSDPLYQLRKKKQLESTYGPASEINDQSVHSSKAHHTPNAPASQNGGKDEEDDLDGFFASVEEAEKKVDGEEKPEKAKNSGEKDDDDLDDFFESLT